jgi:hypothetical protein
MNYGEQTAWLQADVLFSRRILTLFFANKAVLFNSIAVVLALDIRTVVNI